jgi:hypothetical protein
MSGFFDIIMTFYGRKYKIHVLRIDTDPAKLCGSDPILLRIRIHNTVWHHS